MYICMSALRSNLEHLAGPVRTSFLYGNFNSFFGVVEVLGTNGWCKEGARLGNCMLLGRLEEKGFRNPVVAGLDLKVKPMLRSQRRASVRHA